MENAPPLRYSTRAIILHWLTAGAIFIAIPLGLSLEHAPQNLADFLYQAHWSFGLLAFVVIIVRSANRLICGAPPAYTGLTRLELRMSSIVHKALYLLMIAVPLSGWLAKSAYGGAITVFGLFDWPALLGQNQGLGEKLFKVHEVFAKLLILALVLHIAGALKHWLVNKDGVLNRMLLPRK